MQQHSGAGGARHTTWQVRTVVPPRGILVATPPAWSPPPWQGAAVRQAPGAWRLRELARAGQIAHHPPAGARTRLDVRPRTNYAAQGQPRVVGLRNDHQRREVGARPQDSMAHVDDGEGCLKTRDGTAPRAARGAACPRRLRGPGGRVAGGRRWRW